MVAEVAHGVPEVVGDYRLGELLGKGGFGEVFAATHTVIGGDVAVKILFAHRCTNEEAIRRFIDEARAVNQIRHPAIVDIFDFGKLADGRSYCVMERIRGRTLRSMLDAGRLPVSEAVTILRKIAAAVDAAHAVGIAHRDLKPENVFVLDDGEIKLIDFGIAKLSSEAGVTETGTVMGTPRYMAPEQCRGDATDTRSDLYSFGALAYQVLTGTLVFDGDPLGLALAHLNDRPELPSKRAAKLPPGADTVLLALLAKDPDRRPSPLIDAVDRLAVAPPRGRGRWILVASTVTAIAVAAGIVAFVASRRDPARPPVAPSPKIVDADAILVVNVPAAGLIRGRPWLSPDGKELIYDTPEGTYDQRLGGAERLSIAAAYSSRLPDGRWVRSTEPDEEIFVDDPSAPQGRRRIATGRLGEASPCDTRVVFVEHGVKLRLVDADGGETSELGPAGFGGARWSPDCAHVIWTTNDSIVHVIDLASRRVTDLPIQIVRGQSWMDGGWMGPAAFFGPEHVIYCGGIRGQLRVMLHRLSDRTADEDPVLTGLAEPTPACSIASARDHTAVIASFRNRWASAILDLGDPAAVPRILDDQPGGGMEFDTNTSLVVFRGKPGELVRVSTTDGSTVPFPVCRNVTVVIRRRGAMLGVARDGAKLGLVDGACAPVETWTLPTVDGWADPSCSDSTCVTARVDGDRLRIYELSDGKAREVGAFDEDLRTRGNAVNIALSPDGNTVVAYRFWSAAYGLLTLDGKRHEVVHLGKDSFPNIAAGLWAADGTHFYATTRFLDGVPWGITRFGLDGSHELVYRSPTTPAWAVSITPDGKTLGIGIGPPATGLMLARLGTPVALKPPGTRGSPTPSQLTPVATGVNIRNRRAHAVDLEVVEAGGGRRPIMTVQPGQLVSWETTAGQLAMVREGTTDLGAIAAATDFGLVEIGPPDEERLTVPVALQPPGNAKASRKPNPGDPTTGLMIKNLRAHSIDMWWMSFDGTPLFGWRLGPGKLQTVTAFAGHSWLIREGNVDLGSVVVAEGLGRVEVH